MVDNHLDSGFLKSYLIFVYKLVLMWYNKMRYGIPCRRLRTEEIRMGRVFNKNTWAFFLIVLSGIVLGGFFGYLARNISWLSWLNYGQEFGIGAANGGALRLDLGVLVIQFGLSIKITIASIIGIIVAIFIYRRF